MTLREKLLEVVRDHDAEADITGWALITFHGEDMMLSCFCREGDHLASGTIAVLHECMSEDGETVQ